MSAISIFIVCHCRGLPIDLVRTAGPYVFNMISLSITMKGNIETRSKTTKIFAQLRARRALSNIRKMFRMRIRKALSPLYSNIAFLVHQRLHDLGALLALNCRNILDTWVQRKILTIYQNIAMYWEYTVPLHDGQTLIMHIRKLQNIALGKI